MSFARPRFISQFSALFTAMPLPMRRATFFAVAALALGCASLVWATGGAQFAWLHLMYLPIVLAGLAFGVAGGLAAGIAGGWLIGPVMPLDTATGQMQTAMNWGFRLLVFTLVGALTGLGAQALRRQFTKLRHSHEHDLQTGLPNLAGFGKQFRALAAALPPAAAPMLVPASASASGIGYPEDSRLVLCAMQINNLLEIQNTFGIPFGAQAMAQVIERMKATLPADALLALAQTDRLVAVLRSEDASRFSARSQLEGLFRKSFEVEGVPIHMAVSIGAAHYPSHADTAEGLLQKAGIAMHQAASRKVILTRYDNCNDRTSRDNLLLLGRLPQAIERGELEVWHQAKFSLVTGEVAETEALVRWRHPERGIVPPDSFIPQVEETLLINPVTQAVIIKAFADAKAWRETGYRMSVAINLSVRNLLDDTLLATLEEQAALNGLTPQDIGLEITESAIMVEPQRCTRLVSALRERGYGIAIDDFGTGHASLAYLQKLRVSALKIDQTFVRTLSKDADNRKIVQAILNLAMSLGISTVAEGVEDVESFSLLRDWGCDYAQGYYLHRPAPANELARFLDERHARLRAMRRAEV